VSVVSRAFADDVFSRFQWFAARAAVGAFKFEVSAELTCVSMSGAALNGPSEEFAIVFEGDEVA
jgi:hypothetical protein